MKLNIDFQRLEALRKSIGAEKAEVGKISSRRSIERSPIEIKLLEHGSLILSGEELDKVGHFPAGIAAIVNTQITLHIFHPDKYEPKYHVADCKTLKEMRGGGRYDRYVSTAKSDGYFHVEPVDNNSVRNCNTKTRLEKTLFKLAPCQNCLNYLNYDGFEGKKSSDKKSIVNDFDIQKFFKNYEPIFRCLPLYTPDTFPEGNYTADWARISENERIKANWKCSSVDCRVDLTGFRHLLHVHHLDGNRGNNKPSNLEPLCCVCHQQKPLHGKMVIDPEHKRQIENLRASDLKKES